MKKIKKSSRKPAKKAVKVVKKRSAKKAKAAKVSRPAKSAKPAKAPKAQKLPKKELEIYKKLLLQIRGKIAGDLEHIEGDSLSANQPSNAGELSDVSDMATDNYDRELNIGLASNEQQILNDIDVALKRIEEGTYGICEIYGTEIPKKRLLAMPYTRLSMKAQEEEEKNQRRS
jgi:DnaK suppressor protein